MDRDEFECSMNEYINKYMKKESSTVSTYGHMVHELITVVEGRHRGLKMQYPRFKIEYTSIVILKN